MVSVVTRAPRLSLTLVTHCQRCGGTRNNHNPGCEAQGEINRDGLERARIALRRSLEAGGRAGPPPAAKRG